MLFKKFLEQRNGQIQEKAADLLTFLGLPTEQITAYEESLVIETVEKIIDEKKGHHCYPYYGDNEIPCYLCGDCLRQQAGQCQFILENAYVFTFGTDEQFPFGIKDYVLVFAENEAVAVLKFREKYADHTPGTVNCAFWYPANEYFSKVRDKESCKDTIY